MSLASTKRLGAIAAVVRMRDTEHHGAHASGFVRHLGRRCRRNLHGVEMPRSAMPFMYLLSSLSIVIRTSAFSICAGAIRRDPVEARRHRIPVAAKVACMNLAWLVSRRRASPKIAGRSPGCTTPKIDLLVVEAGVLLLVRRRRAHEDRPRDPPGRRVAVQVRRRLVDLVRRGRCAIDIAGDDRLPTDVEVVEQFRLYARRAHRNAARHDHHRGSPFIQSSWMTCAINRSTPRVRWNFSSDPQLV